MKSQKLHYQTTQKYFCHLRFYYTNLNYFLQKIEIFSHFMLTRQCFDMKRRLNEINIQKRIFIIKNLLFKLLNLLNKFKYDNVNLYATFCLIFVDMFKINEFTYKQIDKKTKNFDD